MPVRIIKSVMTPFPYSVGPGAPVSEADRMMRSHDIHHLPVKSGDELVGVVSAADLKRSSRQTARVADVMQTEPYVVELGSKLADILVHMADNHIECVVVTKAGRLAGIFTVVDACRAFAEELRLQHPDSGDAA